jgi:uncharacterized protein (TIGR03437 family)
MLMKTLKLALLALFGAAAFFYGAPKTHVHANAGGPPASRTSAPGEQNCTLSGCHTSFALNSGPGTVAITGLPDNYTPGQAYTVTFTITQTNRTAWGFQITVLDEQNRFAGTLTATDAVRTTVINGNIGGQLRRYIQHTSAGTNQTSWSFRWTAPATAVGRITMYAAGNAANDSGTPEGDYIYTTNKAMAAPATVATVTTVSAATYNANATVAANSIAALFGPDLATGTTLGTTNPPATTLGGVTVRIRDASNMERDAGLFFVSAQQINLLIPADTANGAATVTVIRNGTTVGQGMLTIDTIATGLFTANAQGSGLAAANLLRVKADGSLVYEPVARFNASNQLEAVPIVFGPADEQAFLILYGTAFRANTGGSTATIGGESAEVLYAGPQGDLAGLDQANVRLSRLLAGRGSVNVVLTVGGKTANTVTVTVQ